MIVSRINPEGHVDTFNFCEDTDVDGKKVKGCASSIMTKTHLKSFVERKDQQEKEAEKLRKESAKVEENRRRENAPEPEVENGKQASSEEDSQPSSAKASRKR
jgi:hypothetical protein